MSFELHVAAPAELDASTLYRILRLRVEVFVVEQQCPYLELDGRDLEPDTRWLWATRSADPDGPVLATLRILREPSGTARIGRVATAAQARSGGLATELVRHALRLLDGDQALDDQSRDGEQALDEQALGSLPTEVVLDAQTPLAGWYRRFGFEPDGAEFVEDGIGHLPMRRPAVRSSAGSPARTGPARTGPARTDPARTGPARTDTATAPGAP